MNFYNVDVFMLEKTLLQLCVSKLKAIVLGASRCCSAFVRYKLKYAMGFKHS